jgi:hypothetical protein
MCAGPTACRARLVVLTRHDRPLLVRRLRLRAGHRRTIRLTLGPGKTRRVRSVKLKVNGFATVGATVGGA